MRSKTSTLRIYFSNQPHAKTFTHEFKAILSSILIETKSCIIRRVIIGELIYMITSMTNRKLEKL